MITKSKVVVVAILFVVLALFAVFVADERIERNRMATQRITMRYGALMIGLGAGSTPYGITPVDFNMAMGSELAARLGLRPAFFTSPWERIFVEFDTGIYDIVISSVPITPQRQAVFGFSKPYMATNTLTVEPALFGIVIKKENDRLTEAVNRALEDMFNDGTILRISMDTLGEDLVTQARQAW